jgi:polysaccharide deacetylase family protein (PEP-CTERM system associated)
MASANSGGWALQGALTIDVEDWYQSYTGDARPISARVVVNTERVMDLLDEHGVKATFFVLGEVVRRFPKLVQAIHGRGHEVQSHGEHHVSIERSSRHDLVESLKRARAMTEDVCGARVSVYRAPYFSICERNLWALEAVFEAGFVADSSVFPVRTRRYGMQRWPLAPGYVQLPSGERLLELPVTAGVWRGLRLPVGGGGYWRLLPLGVLCRALDTVRRENRPLILYFHAYEFALEELASFRGHVHPLRLWQQGAGRAALGRRLRALLKRISFGRLDRAAEAYGVPYSRNAGTRSTGASPLPAPKPRCPKQ